MLSIFFNRSSSVYIFLSIFCLLLLIFVRDAADSGLQFYLLLFLVIPAFVLALSDSKCLIPYIIGIWAFGPEVRRIVDWSEGHYQSVSLLSLAPLLATASIIVTLLARHPRVSTHLRTALIMFGTALAYGLVIGLAHNGFACIFDLANYALPLLILLYAVARPARTQERDFWIATFSAIAIAVAIYGWIQFLCAPAWDVFWMKNSTMASIGSPEPFKIRVFSTLNSPGPAAEFLAAAIAPMFLERRWRGGLGWLGVIIVASALGITLVRSSWLMLLVTIVVYILLSSSKDRWNKVLTISLVGLMLFGLIPFLPGGSQISSRIQTLGKLNKDSSANARSEFATDFIPSLLSTPFGLGLGTVGQGSKIDNNGKLGAYATFDNGFYALFITFGFLGGLLIFIAIWLLGKAVRSRVHVPSNAIYSRLAVATLASVTFGLISANMLTGLGGMLMWLFVGLAMNKSADTDRHTQTKKG